MKTLIIDGFAFALPLFIIAVAGIYSERSGIINLALEGIQGFGAFTGALAVVLIASYADPHASYLPYMALIFAAMGGIAAAGVHALLCIRFKANHIISSVVVNILAMATTVFLTKQINAVFFSRPSDKFILSVFPRFTVPYLSEIPFLGYAFMDVYTFLPIIILVALMSYVLLYKTPYGLHLRACGENPQAVDACGISVANTRYSAVLISGALAGLGGICFAYLNSASFSPGIYLGNGYLAIAALIFGNWRITPTLWACLFFGFARSGGYRLSQYLALPGSFSDLVMILPYILTLLLLVLFSKNSRAPKALGDIYDKGKR